jgi:hypothetical protein
MRCTLALTTLVRNGAALLFGLIVGGAAPLYSSAADQPPPSISITSRVNEGDVVHVKGTIEGTGLKWAGIYQGDRCIKAFKMAPALGPEKIELDLAIGNPTPDTIIRVTDAEGRSAEAPIADLPATAGVSAPAALNPPAGSFTPTNSGPANSVVEIPSHGPPMPSPSKRHTLGARLADVRIEVMSITEIVGTPPTFEVKGRIEGTGVTHAGIYVDGRLVEPLPVSAAAGVNEFDQNLQLEGGSATIRAYGVGNQFVENALDLSSPSSTAQDVGPGEAIAALPPPSAPGIGVEITSVQPTGANLYTVSGVITGRGIESAGLYQNGALAQEISVGGMGGMTINGAGLGDLLGSIIPSRTKTINFNVRYNPASGPASIRAYAKSGEYTEQPLMLNGLRE